jgi:two-component system chemotaxis response regulator CheB
MVVVATSTGGLAALSLLLGDLPESFPVPILVVQHMSDHFESHSDQLLNGTTDLDVQFAAEAGIPAVGGVYLARPGRHLTMSAAHTFELSDGPKVQFVRPSADSLFKSVAERYGASALAVVLTGRLADGASGVHAIKAAGGRVIVQDPRDSVAPGMPEAAIAATEVDFVLPLREIAPTLVSLA